MKPLSELIARLPNVQTQGATDKTVTHLTHDSRTVEPGSLFLCIQGEKFDGHAFAADALARGAVALVATRAGLDAAQGSLPPDATLLLVPDTRAALPLLACAYYDDPSQALTMVGVTGTNGKTTTVRMIAAILREAGRCVGTIGTLGAELDGDPIPSAHTTPEADQLQAILATMRDRGANAVVMEVSSHALALHRTDGIAFNVGVFTNLTQDHLDFHQTMESYFEAKARLFTEYPVQTPRRDGRMFASILYTGQWEGRELVSLARGDVLTFALEGDPAVLTASKIALAPTETRFTLTHDDGVKPYHAEFFLPVGGSYQVQNALGAIGTALRLGVTLEVIQRGLAHLPQVPGRFESVPTEGRGFSVIVDYAHTPDGLENVLNSARALNPNRILCVFGCGGNRDRTKRPKMGRLAATLAETAIVTSDNPRKEDPNAIIQDILAGMDRTQDPGITAEIHVEPDRRAAIAQAIQQAQPGDLVLIAGKGHEDYQIVGEAILPFDDRLVAREILASLPPSGSARA